MSRRSRVKIDFKGDEELIAALRKKDAAIEKVARRAAESGGDVLKAGANRRAPGPHIISEASDNGKGRVIVKIGPDKAHWHYRFHETGADVHIIKPKKKSGKKKLKFQVDGQDVFAAQVRHPGRPAEPFLRPAIDEDEEQAVDAVGRVLRSVIE